MARYFPLSWEIQRWPPILLNGTVNEDLVIEDGLWQVISNCCCPKSREYSHRALLFFSRHGHHNNEQEVFWGHLSFAEIENFFPNRE